MKNTIEYCGISDSDVKLVKDYYSNIYPDIEVAALPKSGLVGAVSRDIINPGVILVILSENVYSEVKTKAPRFCTSPKLYKFTSSEDLEAYCKEQTSLSSRPVLEDEDSDVPELTQISLPETDFTEDQSSSNSELEEKIKELSDALAVAKKENSHLQDELNGRDIVLRNLQRQVQDLEDLGPAENKELEAKNRELEEKVTSLEAEVITLSTRNSDTEHELQTKLDFAENKIAELEEDKQNLEIQIEQTDSLSGQLGDLTEENATLNATIEEMTAKEEDLVAQVASMEDKLSIAETQLENKDKEYGVLQTTCEEQRTANKSLQAELDTTRETLDAEKAKVVNLEGELTVLRMNANKQSASEEKLNEVTAKLRTAQQEVINLQAYKARCTELEIHIAEQKAKNTPTGIFASLSKMQALRSVFTSQLFSNISLATDTICVAAGSSESVTEAYNLIRTSCQATTKKCLIIDLSLDSYIDREFGARGISCPVDWLAGKAPFTNFLAKTSLPNAMIISLGLAYTNDVALLSIDWQAKLNELRDFADKIIIYVGPLVNTVSKILFNSFSNSLQSHIVLKATPINIRTLLLTLTGLTNINTSLLNINCVNYTTNSKVMYENLAAKYNSRILSSTEVIQL
jgi:hypothetical protein